MIYARFVLILALILVGLCACGETPTSSVPVDAGEDVIFTSDAPSVSDVASENQDGGCYMRSCSQLQAECGYDDYGRACGHNGDFGAAGECPGGRELVCGGSFRCVSIHRPLSGTQLAEGRTEPFPNGSRSVVMFTLPRRGYVEYAAGGPTHIKAGAFSAEIVRAADLPMLDVQGCSVASWASSAWPRREIDGPANRGIEDMPEGAYALVLRCRGPAGWRCIVDYRVHAEY